MYLFIALEVFPAMNTTDVVRPVTELIQRHVAPAASYPDIKERIGIGRIFGTRSEIVHNGLAVVDITRSPDFDRRLEQLEAIARVCMRVLGGMPAGTALDRFLTPETP